MDRRIFCLIAVGVLILGSCSIEKMALRQVTKIVASGDGGSRVFTGEEDPELLGQALPFALKLYESLLEAVPDDPGLLLTTGQAFLLYTHAFVQTPAEMLPDEDFKMKMYQMGRAKKLYLRAKRYCASPLEQKNPSFRHYWETDDWQIMLGEMSEEDVPFLYWTASAWLGAFSMNPFDMEMLVTLPRTVSMVYRVLELDESYDEGGVHELLISINGSLSPEMGGSEAEARAHFDRALSLSGGAKAGPYMALATTLSVNQQNYSEFRELLEKIIALDVDADPRYRLLNIVYQRKARWLLDHAEDFFLEVEAS